MISKLPNSHQNPRTTQKTVQNHLEMIEQPVKQPQVIQNKTFTQFRAELKSIEQKIENLKTKRYSSKQNQWINLNRQINKILGSLKLKKLRKILERKFEEQIRLLNDFYTSKYRKSMFQFCFLCCLDFITKKFKYYKFIDEVFEKTISEVQKTQRNIYFYVNLLYIKLFTMMAAVNDRLTEEFNKKMIEAITVQSKQEKITQLRKKQVGELQEINDVFVMEEENFKNLEDQNKIFASYIIESDNPNQIKSKTQPREPLDTSLMKQNFYDDFKKLQKQIQTIISKDWKDIINCEEWSSQSYYGFIQINSEPPICTYLQFKDCKLKTNHLFEQISSSSFDLRTYLIRYSKKAFAKQQYVLNSLNQDSVHFQLTFWLSQSDNTEKNHQNIQQFLLLVMRIGIKEKIYRACNPNYKESMQKWMIHNYVHMSYNQKQQSEEEVKIKEKVKSETSYRSLSQSSQKTSPEMFRWVNLGEALLRAIVEVANKRRIERKDSPTRLKKEAFKKKSVISNQQQNNPESINRLLRPPNLNKKNYHSAKQI